MTTEEKLTEELETEQEEIETTDTDTDQGDVEEIKAENERLRKQNEKLKEKKQKAIEKSQKKAVYVDELEQFYATKKQQEWFEQNFPDKDYEAINAVAQAKGVDIKEAANILGWSSTSSGMTGRDVRKVDSKTAKEQLDRRKKVL